MIYVRKLNEDDAKQTEFLDELSGNNVCEWLECEDSGYGIFDNNKLIGYCTLNYADDCGDVIENHPDWTNDSRLLSNVYVLKEYRNQGIGKLLINTVLQKADNNAIFLTVLYPELCEYYKKFGFTEIDEEKYAMVKI